MKVAVVVLFALLSVAFGGSCTARWYCGPSKCYDNGICTKDYGCRNQCFCDGKFATKDKCPGIEKLPKGEWGKSAPVEEVKKVEETCSARCFCGPSICNGNMCTKDIRCRNQCFCGGKYAKADKCPSIEEMPQCTMALGRGGLAKKVLKMLLAEETCSARWYCGPSICNGNMCTKDIRCRNQCFCNGKFAGKENCPGIENMPQGGKGNILLKEPVVVAEQSEPQEQCSARWFCGPSSCNADRTICTKDIRCRNQCFCGKSFAKPEKCPGIENMPEGNGKGNLLMKVPISAEQSQPQEQPKCSARWFCGSSHCSEDGRICTMDYSCRNQCFCNGKFAKREMCPGIENMPQGEFGKTGKFGKILAKFF